ncbi:Sm snRNP core protein Smb1 [Schizosaccharomyces japonicus yFS275]|uniref:Sm protein B n=1 Tax=Schizosaccharomyces japonicus (strain yFS275 / FY16936) TaxID=402676 RepID=B6K215_SCHJY|nr:Sm snRNP core protein Smb1 [Schizosaccharomyces japonicus yFS275]EEB07196.1 Sm snRNP core protein Smb1 [Schizosaccharomyces japonicus yFS275]
MGSSKMVSLINHSLNVTTKDGRTFSGYLMAFDAHMNLVLSDCQEFRHIKKRNASTSNSVFEEKRMLGLVILRGEFIVSLSVQGPPPMDPSMRGGLLSGPGIARPAGRGMPITQLPAGLTGPVRGVGFAAPPPPAGLGRGVPPPGFRPI